MNLSHGLIKNVIPKELIHEIKTKTQNFISKKKSKIENYYEISSSEISAEILINEKLNFHLKKLLNSEIPKKEAIELHIQRPGCEAIPFHQDNFYHCLKNPEDGLKILIPLNNLTKENGGLGFANCEIQYPVLPHLPSRIRNFSSYIEENEIKRKDLKYTFYDYEVGDISYHYINSIHFSHGNNTPLNSLFLVFRYQIPNAEINYEAQKKYNECYKKYLLILKSNQNKIE